MSQGQRFVSLDIGGMMCSEKLFRLMNGARIIEGSMVDCTKPALARPGCWQAQWTRGLLCPASTLPYDDRTATIAMPKQNPRATVKAKAFSMFVITRSDGRFRIRTTRTR